MAIDIWGSAEKSGGQSDFVANISEWLKLSTTKFGGMWDFFVVPTVTFRVLFVLVILPHDRRRIVHFNVTEHPTAQWTAQQVVEAFPWDEASRYLLRDRDHIYGTHFRQRVRHMGIEEVLIAP